MGDKSPERLSIGNNEFRDWLKNLDIESRLRVMTGISKGLAMRGVPGFKISEALVQLSQRCSVMLIKLPKETIKHYTKLRRKPNSVKSKTRHPSKSHLSALTNCANTSRNKNIHTDKENYKKLKKINSEKNADSKKRKRMKERYRELFGEDYANDLESNPPLKKVKRDMVCASSHVVKNADTKSKIVQTNKVHRTSSLSSDEEWNRMGLPSPAQRSKCILNENMMETMLLTNQEIPKENPEDHLKPKIGSIRVRSLSELTYEGFQQKTQVKPIDNEMPIINLIDDETPPADPEMPINDSKVEDEMPLAIEEQTPLKNRKEDRKEDTPVVNVKEVDPKEAEKCFWIVYNLNFNDQLEGDIRTLGELLWLAGTYWIQKKERIDRAKLLSSDDLAMEEKQRAEVYFSAHIQSRGNDFAPLFLELFNKFEDSGNSGNKRTLFIMLFCRILHHAQSFNSDNASPLDTNYIELARELTSLMISNYQPGYDIFNDLKIDPQLFVSCLKTSYRLIFSIDESQTTYNDIENQQVKQPDEESSLSPAASQLTTSDQNTHPPQTMELLCLPTLPGPSQSVNSNEVVATNQETESLAKISTIQGSSLNLLTNEVVATDQETESLAKISTIQGSSNLPLIRESNRPTLAGPQQMVSVQDNNMNQDVRPTVISKPISKTPFHCSNQSEPRSDSSHHQSVPCNRMTDLNEASNQFGSVQITKDSNPPSNVNRKDNQSVVISPQLETNVAQQTASNPALCPNNQTLRTNPNTLIQKELTSITQSIGSNPPNNQPPHMNSKPNLIIAQNSTQMCQPKSVASKAKPSLKTSYSYKQLNEEKVTQAVEDFLASKTHSNSQNQAQPTCDPSTLNHRAPQDTRFKMQSRPAFSPRQPPPTFNPNISIALTNYQLTTAPRQSFVSKTNSFPPIQPRPYYNPNNINQNFQSTSQHSQASLQTLSGQSVYQTNQYAHFYNYTPNVNIQSAGICSQSSRGPQCQQHANNDMPRNPPSYYQYQPRPIYNPPCYIQRAQNNVARMPTLPESRTAPLVSQYRQPSNAANSQCIQGISHTRRFQPILPRQVVDRPGSNAANLHLIQPVPGNVYGPNNKAQAALKLHP